MPCGLPFPSCAPFVRVLCWSSSRGRGLPALCAALGSCAGWGQGDGSQPASPGQGRQPGRQDVMGRAQHRQQDTGCSQEAKCQISAVAGRKDFFSIQAGAAAIQKNTRPNLGLGQVFHPIIPCFVSESFSLLQLKKLVVLLPCSSGFNKGHRCDGTRRK